MIASIPAAGSLLLSACKDSLPPSYGSLFDLSNSLTFASHRLLLRNQPMVREFGREMITKNFPAINETNPKSDRYQHQLAGGFAEWRLPVEGLVSKPVELSLETLKRFPSRTQVTQHNCEQGWSAIAEWTGVPLGHVLQEVGMLPQAGYPLQPDAIGHQQMIERAMKAAEENPGRAAISLVRHFQRGPVQAKIGPAIVIGKLPEIGDRHRLRPIEASPDDSLIRCANW